jgi:hypothetical protein
MYDGMTNYLLGWNMQLCRAVLPTLGLNWIELKPFWIVDAFLRTVSSLLDWIELNWNERLVRQPFWIVDAFLQTVSSHLDWIELNERLIVDAFLQNCILTLGLNWIEWKIRLIRQPFWIVDAFLQNCILTLGLNWIEWKAYPSALLNSRCFSSHLTEFVDQRIPTIVML